MTTDPWHHMLLSIEPAYDTYKDAMLHDPKYVPILTHVRSVWEIKIDEQWADGIKYGTTESGFDLDKRCTWADIQLRTWNYVSRQSWNQWHFKSKQDAKKFITLYYLKWQ